jgi:hypothetical protein
VSKEKKATEKNENNKGKKLAGVTQGDYDITREGAEEGL